MLNHNLRGCGTWHRAWRLARELAGRGHAVTLWTAAPRHFYRPQPMTEAGVRIVETPSWAPLAGADDGWGPLDAAWRAGRALLDPHDLVYAFAHPPNVALPAFVAHRLRGRPLLADWCDWYAGGVFPKRERMRREGLIPPGEKFLQARAERWELALERRVMRAAGRLTVISRRLREVALALGRREAEILLLPNGANLDGIRPQERGACRRELNLPADAPLLGYIANYHPDQELMVRTLMRARERLPELRLVVAGPPLAPALIRDLHAREAVIELGRLPVDRMQIVLGAADALLLPLEDNEHNRARMPFKFTDYLAAGRPVVTSPVGDLADYFGDAAAPIGAAAPPEPDALAAAIAALFHDPARIEAMGHAARRLAEREFSWPRLAEQLERFIDQWLAKEK